MRINLFLVLGFSSFSLFSAPKAEPWLYWESHNPENRIIIDHSSFQNLLDRYLIMGEDEITRWDYGGMDLDSQKHLEEYIFYLENLNPLLWNRDEQMAYWINLYNAVTIVVILENYPLRSIRDISDPWDTPLIQVNGKELSLNDIEHRILRPIWKDERIHFAVNCASLGCPNLSKRVYSSVRLEEQLNTARNRFLSHPRGARIEGNRIILSSIFHWYADDFGGESGVRNYIQRFGPSELAAHASSSRLKYDYNWRLNDSQGELWSP